MDDRAVRRAGLDYWPEVQLTRHKDLESLYHQLPQARFVYLTTKADTLYTDWTFHPEDCLVFGRETAGLPRKLLNENRERWLRIPMFNPNARSLNLSNCVALVLFEALRQRGFSGEL